MIVDANVLLYAHHEGSPHHEAAREWLTAALNGPHRVGLPWQSLQAFARLATNPRVFTSPLSAEAAATQLREWLDAPMSWLPTPTAGYAEILLRLLRTHRITGPLVTDAALAALALDHGVPLVSTDGDFARFDELTWIDPLR